MGKWGGNEIIILSPRWGFGFLECSLPEVYTSGYYCVAPLELEKETAWVSKLPTLPDFCSDQLHREQFSIDFSAAFAMTM